MKHKTKTKALSLLLSLALVLGLMPAMGGTAEAATQGTAYVDAAGEAQSAVDATVLESDTVTWSDAWYVVPSGGVTISGGITVSGEVSLILSDDATLTAEAGITVQSGGSLTVYAQTAGSGALTVTGVSGGSAISGTVVINGGTVSATGGKGRDESNGKPGGSAFDGTVTVNGGTVNAAGGEGGQPTGSGAVGLGGDGIRGTLTVSGGTVNATGCHTEEGYPIKKGGNGILVSGALTVSGGTVNATGGKGSKNTEGQPSGAGGSGICLEGTGTLTVRGGLVNAIGGEGGEPRTPTKGIGGNGGDGIHGDLTVSGGMVKTSGGDHGSAGRGTPQNGAAVNGTVSPGGSKPLGFQLSDSSLEDAAKQAPVDAYSSAQYAIIQPGHTHSLTGYAVNGATITATCEADECTLQDNTATLTIEAPTQDSDHAAVLTGDTSAFTLSDIQYATKTGGAWGEATTTPPAGKGFHRASITLGGKTASVTYGLNSVTVQDGILNGTVTVPEAATVGGIVTPTVTAETGYKLDSLTARNAGGTSIAVTDGSFTMPEEDVVVNATFKKVDVPVKLTVTGETYDTATACTASLLQSDFEPAPETFTQQVGDKFILMITCDSEYDFALSSSTEAKQLKAFTSDEFKDYEKFISDSQGSIDPLTYLYWVTMPAFDETGELELTVTFQKAQEYTILYQSPAGPDPDAVMCKFNYGVNGTTAVEMKKGASMGETSVWSVTVSGLVTDVGFVKASDLEGVTTKDAFTNLYNEVPMTSVTAQTSAENLNWTDYNGGQFAVIGGNMKTVLVAFVADSDDILIFDSMTGGIETGSGGEQKKSATYLLAVCAVDGEGNVTPCTVTAPAAPEGRTGYDFGGWRGFQGTAPDLEEKVYQAGESISVWENTTLSAVWSPSSSKVTLNLNDGTGESSFSTVQYGQTMDPPEDPERKGFAFDGWTVDRNVTENGTHFPKGSPFDFGSGITSDLDLSAQWNHVHSYSFYQMDDDCFGDTFAAYQKYFDYLHVRICSCFDYTLEAHSFNENGVCACGYAKPGSEPEPVTLRYSYGRMVNDAYEVLLPWRERTETQKQEVTVRGYGKIDDYKFVKWQYSTDEGETWNDLAATPTVSFIIPCSAWVRAIYEDTITQPQIDFKVEWNERYRSLLFWMDYKLPDGYTYVNAGVRCTNNTGLPYYAQQVKDAPDNSMTMGESVLMDLDLGEAFEVALDGADDGPGGIIGGFVGSLAMQAGCSALTNAITDWLGLDDEPKVEYVYVQREDSVLNIMNRKTLSDYMYYMKPINVDVPPIYWETRPGTQITGKTGSAYTLIPPIIPQKNNGNHWLYGIAYLQYKDRNGSIRTIYTNALSATLRTSTVIADDAHRTTKIGQ